MEPSDCSFRASFKAWMGASCLELQCDPERKLVIGKSKPTLVLNDLAQDFLSSAAYCPLANIRPCALQAEFQTQVRTTPDEHGTSKKPLLNMASVPPPYLLHHQWELLRAATGIGFCWLPISGPVYFLLLGHTLSHKVTCGGRRSVCVLSRVHTSYTIQDLSLKLEKRAVLSHFNKLMLFYKL